jgi:hypothetical protein
MDMRPLPQRFARTATNPIHEIYFSKRRIFYRFGTLCANTFSKISLTLLFSCASAHLQKRGGGMDESPPKFRASAGIRAQRLAAQIQPPGELFAVVARISLQLPGPQLFAGTSLGRRSQ